MVINKIFSLLSFGFFITILNGCTYGLLYSDSTEPIVTNMKSTPRGNNVCESGTKLVSVPFVSGSLTASWDSQAIGDAAKKAGLSEIYYADLHTLRILGVWQKQTVQVYGK